MNTSRIMPAAVLGLSTIAVATLCPQAAARPVSQKHWVVEYRQPEWKVWGFSHSLDGTDHRDAKGEAQRFLADKLGRGYEAYMDEHTAGTHAVIYDVHYRLPNWTAFFKYGDKATDKIKAINAQNSLQRMGYEARIRFINDEVRVPLPPQIPSGPSLPIGPR